jgi:hypothetical protein
MRRGWFFPAAALFILFALPAALAAQDFGFGFDDEEAAGPSGGAPAVRIGGEIEARLTGYFDDMDSAEEFKAQKPGDFFSGRLNFSVSTAAADGVINLNLAPVFDGSSSPVSINEAYLRAYFGPVNLEAGIRKLTWGKADYPGPLDVVNPLDLTDFSGMNDLQSLKIARPLVHVSWNAGGSSKLEAVFVPWFEGQRTAVSGRWLPPQMAALPAVPSLPDLAALEYAQAGARFTATFGPADFGVQYYYGRLPAPAVRITMSPPPDMAAPPTFAVDLLYNPYHQIGVDYAQVFFGFNVRAEFAANITGDLAGDDGEVYNPHLAWSLGFDRDLVWGVNLNLQCDETIRLLHDKLGGDPLADAEAGKDRTSTRLGAVLSKTFLRDELELRAVVFWGLETMDVLVMPSIIWSRNDLAVELAFGVFGGGEDGQFGQFGDNNFVKAALTYSF